MIGSLSPLFGVPTERCNPDSYPGRRSDFRGKNDRHAGARGLLTLWLALLAYNVVNEVYNSASPSSSILFTSVASVLVNVSNRHHEGPVKWITCDLPVGLSVTAPSTADSRTSRRLAHRRPAHAMAADCSLARVTLAHKCRNLSAAERR